MTAGEGGEPAPFALVCAYLEEKGYRRDQIKDLTRAYVRRVLGWPREKDGSLRPPARPAAEAPETVELFLRRRLWEQGLSPRQAEAVAAERMKGRPQ